MSVTPSPKPLRRDAERNRQRILEAARVVFARHGLDVSLDTIAKEAGVGVGTVYRRFADKEELIEALFEQSLEEVVGAAREALAVADPWEAFVSFLEDAMCRQNADRGLKQLLMSSEHGHEQIARARDELIPLVTELVERAQRSGQLRPDVAASDFPLIQFGLGSVAEYTADIDPDAWRRVLGLVLDGLRTQRTEPSPLRPDPLETEQIECAMRDWRPRRR
jgi:AcrR family transcriptional regulator